MYHSPCVKVPTVEELKQIASKYGLHLPDTDLEQYQGRISSLFLEMELEFLSLKAIMCNCLISVGCFKRLNGYFFLSNGTSLKMFDKF